MMITVEEAAVSSISDEVEGVRQKYSHWKLTPEEKARRAAEREANRTHCVNGHEFSEKNTYVAKMGKKVCRICQRNAQQKHHGRPVAGDEPTGTRNSHKTHCPQGHEYDEKNTALRSDGSRGCRACTYIRNRKHSLWKLYKIALEDYDKLFEAQNGKCAICGSSPNGQELAVDHHHRAGRVRGLLCTQCNIGLGQFQEDTELLYSAMKYLVKHHNHYTT